MAQTRLWESLTNAGTWRRRWLAAGSAVAWRG
jgi:hypothetical protein